MNRFITNLKILTHSPLVVNIFTRTILVRLVPALILFILFITPIILFLIDEYAREYILYHIRVSELLVLSFLILTLLSVTIGLKYTFGAVIKYWFLELDLLPKNIAKKLDYLHSQNEKN